MAVPGLFRAGCGEGITPALPPNRTHPDSPTGAVWVHVPERLLLLQMPCASQILSGTHPRSRGEPHLTDWRSPRPSLPAVRKLAQPTGPVRPRLRLPPAFMPQHIERRAGVWGRAELWIQVGPQTYLDVLTRGCL